MTSIVKTIKNSLFGKKRAIGLVFVFVLALVLILGYLLWVLYRSVRSYEGFGSDNKLSLSYKYENKSNQASINVHAITDTIISSSSYSAYTPQTIPYSSSPSFVTANIIDMSNTDNLWLIIQSGDHLPKQFDFSVRLDLSLNAGYYINFAVPKKAAITPNIVTIGDNKNIGTINLGNNSIHIKGEGEVRDINNTLYGVISKTMDDKVNPSYVIFDCSFSNVLIDTNSLVIQFGNLSRKKGKEKGTEGKGTEGKGTEEKGSQKK
jgi:hypothetical protein